MDEGLTPPGDIAYDHTPDEQTALTHFQDVHRLEFHRHTWGLTSAMPISSKRQSTAPPAESDAEQCVLDADEVIGAAGSLVACQQRARADRGRPSR